MEIRKKMVQKQDVGKSRDPLTTLKRKLNVDPSQIPPNIGAKQENGKKWNKRIRWSQDEMKEVL
jgi:hypothetical protein